MVKLKVISFTLFGFLFSGMLIAQQDMMLYNVSQVPQSIYANPALIPETRLNVSLFSNGLLQAGKSRFHTTDAFFRDDDGRLFLVGREMIDSFQDRNTFRMNGSADIIHLGFEAGLNYIHFNITEHGGFNLDFPKDASILLREVYEQNFLGQNIVVENLQFNINHYREFGVGFARRLSNRITVGGKLKYLQGVGHFSTNENSFQVNTDTEEFNENNTISGALAFSAQSAGLNGYRTAGSATDLVLRGGNKGFAADLGVNFDVTSFLSVSGAVQNLGGFINWGREVRNFEQPNRDLTVNLFELPEAIDTEGSRSTEIRGQVESLVDSLMGDEGSENSTSFSTRIPTVVNLSVALNVSNALTFTFLNQNIFIEELDNMHFLKVMMQAKLKRSLTAIVAYDLINNQTPAANLGLGIAVNLSAFQLYALTEDILFISNTNDRVSGSIRFGVNFTFGRDNL